MLVTININFIYFELSLLAIMFVHGYRRFKLTYNIKMNLLFQYSFPYLQLNIYMYIGFIKLTYNIKMNSCFNMAFLTCN